MNELEETGQVVRNKYNHYYLPNQFGMVLGTLTINKKGFGFVVVEDQEKDVFIAPDSLKDAFNKDLVLVEINQHSDVERPEGKVIRVIKRGQTKLVGEIKKGKRDYYVDVDDPKFDKRIYVDHAHLHGAMPGHKVLVEIKLYKPILKGDVKRYWDIKMIQELIFYQLFMNMKHQLNFLRLCMSKLKEFLIH